MHSLLENLPAWQPEYAGKIPEQTFKQLRDEARRNIDKAVEIMDAYLTSNNEVLLNIAIEKLHIAEHNMSVLVPVLSDEAAEGLSKLATFIFDIGGVLLGGTKRRIK